MSKYRVVKIHENSNFRGLLLNPKKAGKGVSI